LEGVFIGHTLDSPAYLIWIPRRKRLVHSRNVDFDELADASSTIMGERTSSNNNSGDDLDDDGGGGVYPHRDSEKKERKKSLTMRAC
jgi:hypothetical protein